MKDGKNLNPVLVLGVGRSGTSSVARLLHEELGIYMGSQFMPPDDNNPNGYWEDLDFAKPNSWLLRGMITWRDWEERIRRVVKKRSALPRWGFKDPNLSYFLGFYLIYFEDPLFVRCARPLEEVARSMQRCYNWSKPHSLALAKFRERSLDRVLKGRHFYSVDFSRRISDGELGTTLKNILKEGNHERT